MQRKCQVCGNLFELTNPNRLYCSDVCKRYATNEKAKNRYIKKEKRIYVPSVIDLTMHTKAMDNMKAKEDPQFRKGILHYLIPDSIY
jgi:endogenous inhibitor of DNA gyrase (YacG/DUF329 family)